MTKSEILRLAQHEQVQFLRLQFTDILGQIKNVEVPSPQFSMALDGKLYFDGSSLEGFSRTQERDMILMPDFDTFRVFPWSEEDGESRIASIICDIRYPDGTEFEGCPRTALKRTLALAEKMGYEYQIASEVEFFLFNKQVDGKPTLNTHDSAGYFDLMPNDMGNSVRRQIVKALESTNFKVESSHHEVAPGQHEIDFVQVNALSAADYISSCKYIVRKIAHDKNLHATFMPKPLVDQNGSGMHLHQSLRSNGQNAFYDAKKEFSLSKTALGFIAGQLKHARGFCAITNPLINSYKRLVDGTEAPTFVSWSLNNISPLIRLSEQEDTRIELRLPDPTCNPYLALSTILAAGLDGIRNKMTPVEPVNKDINEISHREQARLKIDKLPNDLNEALIQLKKDRIIQEALGSFIFSNFMHAKKSEWKRYISQIHPWEIEQYFTYY